jgi:hypothetical protein
MAARSPDRKRASQAHQHPSPQAVQPSVTLAGAPACCRVPAKVVCAASSIKQHQLAARKGLPDGVFRPAAALACGE